MIVAVFARRYVTTQSEAVLTNYVVPDWHEWWDEYTFHSCNEAKGMTYGLGWLLLGQPETAWRRKL